MRAIVLEGDAERWQDLLCALGDYGEFQPEYSSGSLPDEEKGKLIAKIDRILTQTETWASKLEFEETIAPIAEYVGLDRLEIEVGDWYALAERIEAMWISYLQRLQEIEETESVNLSLFLSKVAGKSGSKLGLKVLMQAIDLGSTLKRFHIFFTILSQSAAPVIQSEMTKRGAAVISEPLGEDAILLLAYGPVSQTGEFTSVAERYHLLNIETFLLLLRCFSFKKLVEEIAHTLHVLYSSKKFGESLVVTGYVPEASLPALRRQTAEIGFKMVEGSSKDLPVSSKLPTIARNFAKIVAMYSPTGSSYSEVDPTLSIAITFPLFFGFMFGDLGQGLLLLLLGAFLSFSSTLTLYTRGLWKYRDWGSILFLCGLSSSLFGLIYGEFFGVSLGILGLPPILEVRQSSIIEAFEKLTLLAITGGFVQLNLGLVFKAKNLVSQGELSGFFHEVTLIVTYVLGFIYVGGITGFLQPVQSLFSRAPYISQIFLLTILVNVFAAIAVEPIYKFAKDKTNKILPTMEQALQNVAENVPTRTFSIMAIALNKDASESVQTELSQENVDTTIETLDGKRALVVTPTQSLGIGEYQELFRQITDAAKEKIEQNRGVFHKKPVDMLKAFFDLPNNLVEPARSNLDGNGISTEVKKVGPERTILIAYCPLNRKEILGYVVQQFGVGNLVMSWETQKKAEYEGPILGFVDFFLGLIELSSNTISYIRLAVLFLVHTLLMSVLNSVFVLGLVGLPIIILGNVGVIALEGLVVFIQSLRLHFYEFFSKFFQGKGKPYNPVTTCSSYACVKWNRR